MMTKRYKFPLDAPKLTSIRTDRISVASEGCAVKKRRKSQSELTPTVPPPERKLCLPVGENEALFL